MNNKTALGYATLTVVINGIIGHFFAPNGIILTPIVLSITTSLVCFGTSHIKPVFISLLTYLFVALNDILIKLYSGGFHDGQGLGWILILLFVGLLPTTAILLAAIFKSKEDTLINKIMALLLFAGLIAGHLHLFGNLGLGRHY